MVSTAIAEASASAQWVAHAQNALGDIGNAPNNGGSHAVSTAAASGMGAAEAADSTQHGRW
jgi:hypothetical protein